MTTNNPLLSIVSQDAGQDLNINQGAGGRLNFPLVLSDTRRFNFSGGVDWKFYQLKSFNTNNFIITTVVTNSSGSQTIETRTASPQPERHTELNYIPLAFGLDYFQSDSGGTFSASLALSRNIYAEGHEFTAPTNSIRNKIAYSKAYLSLTRDQKIFKTWSLLLRGSGQVATGPLISNEQFPLGGLSSVRGYYEGDEYGDDGWSGSVELRTPLHQSKRAGVGRLHARLVARFGFCGRRPAFSAG